MSDVRRPALRYHGGKWKLADWIISHFPRHRVYVEPFGGGASVLLKKNRSYAEVYNDMDGEIVNLFRMYRDRGDELVRAVSLTPFSRDEFVAAWVPSGDPLEQARRTLVRAYMGFGSAAATLAIGGNPGTGFRANSNRSGTTPAHDWRHFPESMPAIIERLRGVVIENRDASQVMQSHDSPDTLHYVDPPYVAETRDAGSDYRHEMTEQDHIALANTLNALEGNVVLSGYASELYDSLYPEWARVDRAALADGARSRVEVLWIKGETVQQAMAI